MNLKEAYSILEIPETSTPVEAKKKFRELSKKFHPDINKDSTAEAKFKKINEAYQVVSSGKSTDREDVQWQQTAQSYNPFGQMRNYNAAPASAKVIISFAESIFGCEKDIKFNRNIKCSDCNGMGEIPINNGCAVCGGKGKVMMQKNNMIFVQQCTKCNGVSSKNNCQSCQTKGTVETEVSFRVNIPGGVSSGNVLTLRGHGNYAGSFGPLDQYADAHLYVHVTPEPGLSIDGVHVVSNLDLSLKEALQGCKKIINTVSGYQDVDVPALSRNKDEIILPNLGVNRVGNQRVILDVKYPDDVSEIIELLNNSANYKVN